MSDASPRHTVKARRKQKLVETADDPEWRRKYELAVLKRRTNSGNHSPSSPASFKSSTVNNNNNSPNNSINSPNNNSNSPSAQADMEYILAPTFDTFDTAEQPLSQANSNYSADDSIIRRVEAEIAVARKAANYIQSPKNQQGDDDDDEDMAQILNTSTFQSLHVSVSSDNDDSSKNRALDLIRDEFQVGLTENNREIHGKVIATPTTPTHLYFTDEDWQNIDDDNADSPSDEKKCSPKEEKKEEASGNRSYLCRIPASPKDSPKKRSPVRKTESGELSFSNSKHAPAPLIRGTGSEPSLNYNSSSSKQIANRRSESERAKQAAKQTLRTRLENSNGKKSEPAFDIPTRSTDEHHHSLSKPELSQKILRFPRQDLQLSAPESPLKDPDGEYQATPTPPRRSQQLQRDFSSRPPLIVTDNNNNEEATTEPLCSPVTLTRRSPAMARTRELLDSLKEQRESTARSPANRSSPKMARSSPVTTTVAAAAAFPSSPPTVVAQRSSPSAAARRSPLSNDSVVTEAPTSPRSPSSQLYFTRATKAKERVKASTRGRPRDGEQPNKPETALSAPEMEEVAAERRHALETESEIIVEPSRTTGKRATTESVVEQHFQRKSPPTPQQQQQPSPRQKVLLQPKRSLFPPDTDELAKGSTDRSRSDAIGVLAEPSRHIRFRNPFPVLKPPVVRRDLEAIIQDHVMGVPEMPTRWVKPKKELKQLIVAAMGTSLPRRSNACGALKVLTRHEKNKLSLVRTDGFLSALIYAASQSVLDVDTDLAIDARTRAVTCLKNVCGPKDNRVLVFHHPGVLECLVKVVKQDAGEGRAMAAAAIALLAKTPGCREGLVQVEGLIDILAKVMHSAATMESEEAQAVRLNPSPRCQMLADNASECSFRDHDDRSVISDSSSISSLGEHETPSEVSPRQEVVKPVDSIRNQIEERHGEFINQARSNACAALLHISKQCATSVSAR